jgi:hypothetical protein
MLAGGKRCPPKAASKLPVNRICQCIYTNINTHNIHTLASTSKLQVTHSVHSVAPHQHTHTSNSRLFVGVANSIPLVGVAEEVTIHYLTASSHLTLCVRVRLYPIPFQVWNFASLHSCLSNIDETDLICLPEKAMLKHFSITHCTRQDMRRDVREGNLHWDDSQSNPKTQSRTKCVCATHAAPPELCVKGFLGV